jgi:hypothetical protein
MLLSARLLGPAERLGSGWGMRRRSAENASSLEKNGIADTD